MKKLLTALLLMTGLSAFGQPVITRISQLNDVSPTRPPNNLDALIYDAVSGKWTNIASGSLLGTNTFGTMTIGIADGASTASPAQGVFTNIAGFSASRGVGVGINTTDGIFTNLSDGFYSLGASVSFGGVGNATYQMCIFTNGTASDLAVTRKLGTGGDVGDTMVAGDLFLPANTTTDLRIAGLSGDDDANITNVVFSIGLQGGGGQGLTSVVIVQKPNGQKMTYAPSSDTDLSRGLALSNAQAAATSGDILLVGRGDYHVTNYSIGKDGLTYYFEPGSVVANSGATNLIYDLGTGITFDIDGYGTFYSTNADTVAILHSNSVVSLRAKEIHALANSEVAVQVVAGALNVFADYVASDNYDALWFQDDNGRMDVRAQINKISTVTPSEWLEYQSGGTGHSNNIQVAVNYVIPGSQLSATLGGGYTTMNIWVAEALGTNSVVTTGGTNWVSIYGNRMGALYFPEIGLGATELSVGGRIETTHANAIKANAVAANINIIGSLACDAAIDSDITVAEGLVTTNGAFYMPDGVKQTFNPSSTTSGLNVGSVAGDPSSPANGDLWYDSTAEELTARINGSNVALGAGGGGSLATNANQFGASTTITIKDIAYLTNLVGWATSRFDYAYFTNDVFILGDLSVSGGNVFVDAFWATNLIQAEYVAGGGAAYFDGTKRLQQHADVDDTELGYLNGLSENLATSLGNLQATTNMWVGTNAASANNTNYVWMAADIGTPASGDWVPLLDVSGAIVGKADFAEFSGAATPPGGNSGAIQFVEGSSFAGTNDLTFDRTNNVLHATGAINANSLTVTNGITGLSDGSSSSTITLNETNGANFFKIAADAQITTDSTLTAGDNGIGYNNNVAAKGFIVTNQVQFLSDTNFSGNNGQHTFDFATAVNKTFTNDLGVNITNTFANPASGKSIRTVLWGSSLGTNHTVAFAAPSGSRIIWLGATNSLKSGNTITVPSNRVVWCSFSVELGTNIFGSFTTNQVSLTLP